MYQLNVWIHILMATVWTGGLIYTAAVVIPFAISKQGDERQQIIRGLARRFRRIGWASVCLLALTGLLNLFLRPSATTTPEAVTTGESFEDRFPPDFFWWLAIKLVLVFAMIAFMLFHDITSLKAAKQHEGKPGSPPSNRLGSMAAALATLLAIAVLYVSVRLVRG
jgi:copper resistance protein D